VSVILPVYNAEKYIKSALYSLINQSYDNFEIIIIDDCSTDNSFFICLELAQSNKKIKLLQLKQNSGIVGALNYGINHAGGEYIARMDADDICFPQRLAKQVDFLECNPDIGLCGTSISVIDDNGGFLYAPDIVTDPLKLATLLKWISPIAHPTWMVRKNIFDEIGLYRELAPAEDYDFLLRVNKSEWKISNLDYIGIQYRLSTTSTASNKALFQRKAFNFAKRLNSRNLVYTRQSFLNYTNSSPLAKEMHQYSEKILAKSMGLKWKGKAIHILYLIFSIIISPVQLQFISRSIAAKIYKKF
jgi:glycosyltransferase involved in cell wall biosynthesis